MKKVLFIALALVSYAGYSQSKAAQAPSSRKLEIITQESSYKNDTKVYNLDKASTKTSTPVPSGNTAIYHGNVEPVYRSSRGKEFIYVTSQKTGNVYKKYID